MNQLKMMSIPIKRAANTIVKEISESDLFNFYMLGSLVSSNTSLFSFSKLDSSIPFNFCCPSLSSA